ncbi:MAG: ABC transporter permease subunit [Oscillospiraceae bacterium]|jgi:putative aldouronate transport system permease protein|nr:ABC transporter permease subunit [Oscillospiraceae bacterium]
MIKAIPSNGRGPFPRRPKPARSKARALRHKRFRLQKTLQLFVLLGMAYLLIFNFMPMVGIIVAFKKYSIQNGFVGIFTGEWVGFRYFVEFFTDYKFATVLTNTLAISLLKIAMSFPAPILLAIMLNEVRRSGFKRFVQAVSYLPHFISWVVVAGIMTAFFSESKGVINQLLVGSGLIDKGIPFLTSANLYWGLATWTSVWKSTGWWSIIFLAAIAGVDPALYEAAQIDGASRLRRIWHVTLPGIRSSIVVVLILTVGGLLGGGIMGGNFDQTMMLGNTLNNSRSEIIQTYAFRTGMVDLRFNYATAIDLSQSVISLVLIFASNAVSRKVAQTSLF